MIIDCIKIKNIASFKGEHQLHLHHKPGNTITVILGENGAGKTSILQAIKIGLYGPFLFNNNKKNYHTYLNSFIRSSEISASVELDFHLRTLAGIEKYTLSREWQHSHNKIRESLSILKEGIPFQDVTSQFYQEFVFSIIPLGMMGLFFFDGEKINHLGESLSSGEISNAVKKLIGLSAVNDLEAAVQKYNTESVEGKTEYKELLLKLENINAELPILHKRGETLHQQYAEINESIKKCKKQLGSKEAAFFEAGGNLALSHEMLRERKKNLEQKVENIQTKIRELSQNYLPLCVLSGELKELSDQLIVERETSVKLVINSYVEKKRKELECVLIKEKVPVDAIQAALDTLVVSYCSTQQPVHGLSSKQTDDILATIRMVNDVVRPQASELFSEMNTVCHELLAIESALEKIPDDSELAKVLSEIKSLNVQIMKHEKHQEELLGQKKRIENDVTIVMNKKKSILKQIEKRDTESKSEYLANRFPHILGRIKIDLFQRRLETLQRLILHNIKILFRKKQLITDVQITSNFSVLLLGQNGEYIDLRSLSAGEQQMFATAIQWALAALASSNIPTIIDTPLARLDSFHRRSLVENYYPSINQLILLSTDEEINNDLLQQLSPAVSDVYSLKYNKLEQSTDVLKVNIKGTREAA
ncbi:DNA sulfur modification protein DndD [Desulfovibrio inopinatus]|uniref:DNA sulfur modification protein DndD n=1 Tax=Desulfovibrio inopinatus TaxID=102109 RepID=UPI0004088BE0|nr:DNA sulfur modification protein DndD [Desulfovibrio inopinatus]